MLDLSNIAVLATFAFLYSLVAARLEKTPINGALIYVIVGVVLGPWGLSILDLGVDFEQLRGLAELTLAVVLFTDSAEADLRVLRRFEAIPVRLLSLGLPIMILFGWLVAWLLLPDIGWVEAALLATILAPTDAALGKVVVSDRRVPGSVRQSLNAESGLNDGICVPVILILLELAAGNSDGLETAKLAVTIPLKEVGLGVLVGLSVGAVGAWGLRFCSQRGWTASQWLQLPVIALSLLCFSLAALLGGSGFIGAFVGGMIFGAMTRSHKVEALEAAEGTGDTLAMLTWIGFGTLIAEPLMRTESWLPVVYAIASLTLIRIVAVRLAVMGLGLDWSTRLFLGWFGPRGMASIVFMVMVAAEDLPSSDLLVGTVAWTITASVAAHGISAYPISGWYASTRTDHRSESSDSGEPIERATDRV